MQTPHLHPSHLKPQALRKLWCRGRRRGKGRKRALTDVEETTQGWVTAEREQKK